MLVDGIEITGIEQACEDFNEWECFVSVMYNRDDQEVFSVAFASNNEWIVYNNDTVCILHKINGSDTTIEQIVEAIEEYNFLND